MTDLNSLIDDDVTDSCFQKCKETRERHGEITYRDEALSILRGWYDVQSPTDTDLAEAISCITSASISCGLSQKTGMCTDGPIHIVHYNRPQDSLSHND